MKNLSLRILATMMALLLIVGLAACGGGDDTTAGGDTTVAGQGVDSLNSRVFLDFSNDRVLAATAANH